MVVAGGATAAKPELDTIHVEINDGRGKERQELAEDEATDDGDAEGAAQFGANTVADGERKGAEERGHGGHENGAEAKQTGFVNGFDGRQVFLGLGLHGEVDHEDGVLFDDADEQNDTDESDQGQLNLEEQQE